MVLDQHQHEAAHIPPSGNGIAGCECGATARYLVGKRIEEWHTCPLCVAREGVPQGMITEEIYHHDCKPPRRMEPVK